MISKYQIQQLLDLPIEGVAERLGLRISRHVSLCPFHDDRHPSLHFNVRKNRFRCYVCGEQGRTIDLVMKQLRLTFFEACKWLADDSNIILTTQPSPLTTHHSTLTTQPSSPTLNIDSLLPLVAQPVLTEEARKFLFEERKLNPRVIDWCGISSTHTDLIIPYFGIDGNLIGMQWRYLGSDKSKPRFRFPRGSQCGIYNLPVLKQLREGEPLFICEGASDCWAMLSSGHKAIAIPSATLLNRKDIELLRTTLNTQHSPLNTQHSPLHMFPDNDEPGERLFLQLRDLLPQIVRHQLPADCKDFSEAYLKKLKC